MAEMNTAWTAASEDMYKATQEGAGAQQAQPGPGAGGDGQQQSSESKVEDVPFEEVK
jgi:molecular chaperone DnaK